jgi:hypothetical protein
MLLFLTCAICKLVVLRGDEYRLVASQSVVLERVHILQQVCLGEQVSLVTGNQNPDRPCKSYCAFPSQGRTRIVKVFADLCCDRSCILSHSRDVCR